MKLNFQAIWNSKKKRTILILIASAVAMCLLLAVTFLVVSHRDHDKGKEYYELFEWGTSQEAVFKKLDELNVDYEYDMESNEIAFFCRNVQGTDATGEVTMEFGRSGMLKKISVLAQSYYNNEEKGRKMGPPQVNTAMQNLTNKYGEWEGVAKEGKDLFYTWKDDAWTIMCIPFLDNPYSPGFMLTFYKNVFY